MSGNQVNPEQGMLDLNQRMQQSKCCALPLGECPIYCHMNAMTSATLNEKETAITRLISIAIMFGQILAIAFMWQ